jgi:hypothetical protein
MEHIKTKNILRKPNGTINLRATKNRLVGG